MNSSASHADRIAILIGRISDTARRCVELERALAATVGLEAAERAADEALRSTQHLLWLYEEHLARLQRTASGR